MTVNDELERKWMPIIDEFFLQDRKRERKRERGGSQDAIVDILTKLQNR
jgi:hypothetical protein